MVIQCSACDTRFKIADDKLKPGGVKVRCSKCQEIFTVMPPVEEVAIAPPAPEPEPTEEDWSDLNASFNSAQDEIDTDGDDESGTSETEDAFADFSFGDDDPATEPKVDDFSFGDDDPAAEPTADDFAFDPVSATNVDQPSDEFDFDSDTTDDASETSTEISEDAFSFDVETPGDDTPEEAHGQGTDDNFAFDDSDSSAIAPASTGNDDFDWDDGGVESDSFNFAAPADDDANLDFSGISLQEDEPAPAPIAAPAPAKAMAPEATRPETVKGPQKSAPIKKRKIKSRHTSKKKSPWGKLVALILFLALLLGGGAYGMQRMGFWSGDFAQLGSADYSGFAQALWVRVNAQIQSLTGGSAIVEPVGTIAIVEMSGRFIDSSSAGRLFVIDGKVRNDFPKSRSAIAIRGILYNAAGKSVANQKVFCGNTLSTAELRSLPVEKILERGKNQFGDSLSNLDIAPKGAIPFTIVFAKIPKDIVEFNVEVIESSPGSQP